MNVLKTLFGSVAEKAVDVVDQFVTDKDEAAKLKAQLVQRFQESADAELQAKASVIRAEATGESWLQRNWRPMVMLWFAALVGAHWVGFTAENLSEEQILGLLKIVQYGLSGYVVGRSGEKIMREWKKG